MAGVNVPRPDKQMFPATGDHGAITKRGLADYYAEVAAVMLPHTRGRPVNMRRFPDGIDGEGFYEKQVPGHFPEWVGRTRVDTSDGPQDQVVADSVATLVHLAGQACITPHTWLSRSDDLDVPDQLVVDLDPSVEGVEDVRRATRIVGEAMDEVGLVPYVKTTGSRGYHVVVPLRREEHFDDVRDFATSLARMLADREPDLLTVAHRKAKRGDRVFVDVLRNAYGQTMVPPYAVRARPGAPVSTPITWDEVSSVAPAGHTLASVPRRLAQRADPWRGMGRHARSLRRARERLAQLSS